VAELLKKDPIAVIQCMRKKDEVLAYSMFVKKGALLVCSAYKDYHK
jgi:hypothetical protein